MKIFSVSIKKVALNGIAIWMEEKKYEYLENLKEAYMKWIPTLDRNIKLA